MNEYGVVRFVMMEGGSQLFGLWKVQDVATFHQVGVSENTLLREVADLQTPIR